VKKIQRRWPEHHIGKLSEQKGERIARAVALKEAREMWCSFISEEDKNKHDIDSTATEIAIITTAKVFEEYLRGEEHTKKEENKT